MSLATITAAQSALVREKLVVTHPGRGAFVADRKALRSGSHSSRSAGKTLGILTPHVSRDPMGSLKGIYDEAHRLGSRIEFILFHGERDRRECCERMLDGTVRVDGCLIPHLPGYHDVVEAMRQHRFPYLVFQSPCRYERVNQLLLDHAKAAAIATRHLIEHGHERIAYLGAGLMREGEPEDWSSAKFRGYQAALEDAGLPIEQNLIMHVSSPRQQVPDYEQTSQAVKALIDRAAFSALHVAVGSMSIPAIDVLRAESRRVPRDVAITSFNADENERMSWDEYSVSSVVAPREQAGRAAVGALMRLIEQGTAAAPLVEELDMPLARRRSCGCVVDDD